MPVNAMNNTVQTLDVDVGESTSKLVNWSLAKGGFKLSRNFHVRTDVNFNWLYVRKFK